MENFPVENILQTIISAVVKELFNFIMQWMMKLLTGVLTTAKTYLEPTPLRIGVKLGTPALG